MKRLDWNGVLWVGGTVILLLTVSWFVLDSAAHAGNKGSMPQIADTYQWPPISEKWAVKAILGEARGDGYGAMYAVACGIRNRGTLKGVRGVRAVMEPISGELYQLASKAWHTSEDGPDVTHGGDHWENVSQFGRPRWARKMVETAIIGNHVFYKEKNRA